MSSLVTAIGILGNIVSFGLFIAPLHTFIGICKNRVVPEGFSAYPFLASLFNCGLYALKISQEKMVVLLLITNLIGVFVELGYLAIGLLFAGRRIQRVIFFGLVIETCTIVGLYFWIALVGQSPHHSSILGWICVASGVLMYASTMISLWDAWWKKTVDDIMWQLIGAGAVNSLVWLLYGSLDHTLFALVQNGIGVFACFAQLGIYLYIRWYRAPQQQQGHIQGQQLQGQIQGQQLQGQIQLQQ